MVKIEVRAGVTRISGRNKGEWMLVPYWPIGGRTIRKLARPAAIFETARRFWIRWQRLFGAGSIRASALRQGDDHG
jgi:hypothetical protein